MLKNIEVTQDLLDYIYDHSQPLHPVQKDILNHNKTLGDIQRMQISEVQGHFLQLIIKINNVKNCLEIGTFTGFSSLTMALALPMGGKLTTLDHDKKIVHVAKNFFKKGNLDNKIEIVISPALETLKKFSQERKKFDLIFIDADKGNYKKYYELSLNLINKKASDLMTKKPTIGDQNLLVGEALNIMNNKKITSLFICIKTKPIGIVHIHDLLRLSS